MTESSDKKLGDVPFSSLLDNPQLLEALDKLGFEFATPVQELSIPPTLEGKDLVVQAKTGSGKTFAFGLPMMSKLMAAQKERNIDYTFGLVIVPTRELAVQISDVLSDLCPDINATLLIGGMPYPKQKRQLEEHPAIVIGTPGRVLDFIDQKFLKLGKCEMFVLDEADEMFSVGFIKDVENILSEIPTPAQGLFVSATISPRVVSLARDFLKDSEQIKAGTEDEEMPPVEHSFYDVGGGVTDKPKALGDLLEWLLPPSAIIFCNTKAETELVEVTLRRRGIDARRLNSDLNQSQRNRIMRKIRDGQLRYLVATDIAARGIDIEALALVINYSISDQTEMYVHRTGRAGRGKNEGKAINLISPHDFMAFRAVKSEIKVDIEKRELPSEEELCVARLNNLAANLKEQEPLTRPRDHVLSKRILQEFGKIEEPTAELEDFVARLSRFAVEHFVKLEAVSLEEELRGESGPRNDGGSSSNRSHDKGRRSGSRNSGSRDKRSRNSGSKNNRSGGRR